MSPMPPPPAVTLGAHLGDNSVDYVPITAVSLGTTGGCHRSFISSVHGSSLWRPPFSSQPPVDQNSPWLTCVFGERPHCPPHRRLRRQFQFQIEETPQSVVTGTPNGPVT